MWILVEEVLSNIGKCDRIYPGTADGKFTIHFEGSIGLGTKNKRTLEFIEEIDRDKMYKKIKDYCLK